jgi:hypothetical protein
VLLVVADCLNLIYGIAAIASAYVFTANAHHVVGGLRSWGWTTLVIGELQLLAAAGVVAGNQQARWFGVAVLGLSAIGQMSFIPAYPVWSLMIIAVDVATLYGLSAYGSRANFETAWRRVAAAGARMGEEIWLCVISGRVWRCGHSSGRRFCASWMETRSRATAAGSAAGAAGPAGPPR